MNLYLHADRAGALRSGTVIDLEPYRREESALMLLAPCLDEKLVKHLETLMEHGISLHGAQYLRMSNREPDYLSMMTELVYEKYRKEQFPDRTSRLQSLFAFDNIRDALRFAGEGKRIFEVETEGTAYKYDMNALKLSFDPDEQERYAVRYWAGRPLSGDADYTPQWEYLLTMPVKIVREVT